MMAIFCFCPGLSSAFQSCLLVPSSSSMMLSSWNCFRKSFAELISCGVGGFWLG